MKLWQKNYEMNKIIEEFITGDDYLNDLHIIKHDCIASIAHAKMLEKIKILTEEEKSKIIKALEKIIGLTDKGVFKIEKDDEDCHTAIENFLVKEIGEAGKKIHAGRSRNDQVLTALRLYYKSKVEELLKEMDNAIDSMKKFDKEYGKIELPGYTHMRKAMPSSIGLWVNSFIDSMQDCKKLTETAYILTDQSPLGSGAGYPVPMPLQKEYTAKLLGFSRVQENQIYVQNSRGKFESILLNCLTQVMLDLNKIASDLILFSMGEFNYFKMPDELLSGSSIMPHKKNPDLLEILRANYHKILSNEFFVKSLSSNLISGYNRDIQLTKKPMIESFKIVIASLNVIKIIFEKIEVNKQACGKAMQDEKLKSAEKALNLAKKGMPFREAYKEAGKEYMGSN